MSGQTMADKDASMKGADKVQKKRLLIIDDSMAMRALISFALEDAGFSVVTAIDGKDALYKLNTNPDFSLIVSDLNMPNMNGFEFITAVRKVPDCRFVPIIVLTTETKESMRQEAIKAGASGWLSKPFVPEELISLVVKLAR